MFFKVPIKIKTRNKNGEIELESLCKTRDYFVKLKIRVEMF